MSLKPTTVPTKQLAQNLSSAGMVLYVNNVLGWSGAALAASDFGTQLFAALRNSNNTQLELIELDPSTIASSGITILKRALGFDGTQVAGTETAYDWLAGDTFVEMGADTPQLMAYAVAEAGDETVAGVKTFTSSPIVPTPTTDMQAATKKYADDVIAGLVGTADESTYGTTKLSVAPATPNQPKAVGDNDPRLPTTDEKAALAGTFGAPSASNPFVTDDDTTGTGSIVRESVRVDRPSITAYEDITAGDPLKLLKVSAAANVAKIMGVGSDETAFTLSQAGFTTSQGTHDLIALSSTLAVAVVGISDSSSNAHFYLVAGTIAGRTVTWGTPVDLGLMSNGASSYMLNNGFLLVPVDATTFVFCMTANNSSVWWPDFYVCTVSGNTITKGSGQSLGFSTTYHKPTDARLIDTNKIVVAMDKNGSASAVVATVDVGARTLSVGGELSISNYRSVHILSSSRVMFMGASHYTIASLSGTTLSIVTANAAHGLSGTVTRECFLKGRTDQTGMFIWHDGTNSKVAYASESAGTFSVSSTTTLPVQICDRYHSLNLYNSDMDKWLITFDNRSLQVATLGGSSTGITLGENMNAGNNISSSVVTVIGTEMYLRLQGAPTGNASVYNVGSLDYKDFFGFANDTGASGTAVSVNVSGMKDTHQSGLTVAAPVYITSGGRLTASYTVLKLGQALSTTELLITV